MLLKEVYCHFIISRIQTIAHCMWNWNCNDSSEIKNLQLGTTTIRALTSTQPRGVIKHCQHLINWLNNTNIESELATVHQKEMTQISENDKQHIIVFVF